MKTYATKLGNPRVDEKADTIYGVSLISLGNAEGHFDKKGRQEVVDEVTLQQVFKYCCGAKTIKIKANHNGQVEDVIGWCDNFALQAEKVIGDAHFYDTPDTLRHKLYAVASKNPDHIAISLEFTGEDKARGEISLSRCDCVVAASFVSEGAANKSLFSAHPPEDEKADNTNNNTTTMADEKDTKADDETALSKLQKKYDDLQKKFDDATKEPDGDEDGKDKDGDGDGKELKKKLEAGDDADKQPKESDPEKTYSKKDLDNAISAAANSAVKKFAATIGAKALGAPGNGGGSNKEKTWAELVADEAEKHGGNREKAFIALKNRFAFDPALVKAYADQRNVKYS